MPHTLDLTGVRGDEFLHAIPLTSPGPPVRPLTTAEAQAIKDAWPDIHLQVRARAGSATVLIDLTSAGGELAIEPAYPQPDGTTAPALVIHAAAGKMDPAGTSVYDIQFSGPGTGPFTWIGGKFTLAQDVTDATA
ncbi:hypothetical protein [Deinococcus yunweiensis]|uniref:hypothetical protein n=1 Tax=Deinococcus yunweiensis TaxID=367282 RepID=UPI00398EE43B